MIRLKEILLNDGIENPYRFKHTFSTENIDYEDDDTGESYKKDVLSPVQIVRFKSDEGVTYVWYARQSRYAENTWSVAFGVDKGTDFDGSTKLDIKKTGTGNALRVFATVVEIINTFVEFDENYEITRLTFESEGDNRTELYLKRLVPLIDNFKVEHVLKSGTNSTVTLIRKN